LAIRSETTGAFTTNVSTGQFSVNKPGDVQNGDLLVCILGKMDDPDVAPPAGWTTGEEGAGTAENDVFGGIYYKKITDAASEPATYTFDSAGTSEEGGYWIGSLSGIDPTTPEDVDFDTGAGAFAYLANDSSPNAPAVTTVTNGAIAFAVWVVNQDSDATMPGGSWLTRAEDVGTGIFYAASQIFPTGGTSTGTPEITDVGSTDETLVGMFIFRPEVLSTFIPRVIIF
jgi:hypothetical protein